MNDLELYVKNWELIKKYCINVIKIHHNKKDFIDDVMQEAYIKLYDWVNSKNYKYQIKANEDTYIFSTVIKSVIYNKYKENKKEFSLDNEWWNNASNEYSYDQGISEDLDKVLYEEAHSLIKSFFPGVGSQPMNRVNQ